jgi:hypothetical protein
MLTSQRPLQFWARFEIGRLHRLNHGRVLLVENNSKGNSLLVGSVEMQEMQRCKLALHRMTAQRSRSANPEGVQADIYFEGMKLQLSYPAG